MAVEAGASCWAGYDAGGYFCELSGRPAPLGPAELIRDRIDGLSAAALRRRARAAERELYSLGITFTVYSEAGAIDRILPFDLVPRVISAAEWAMIEAGIVQRVEALNLFLHDIYHEQTALKEGVVPAELVLGNPNYRRQMEGFTPPGGVYVHICGIDLIRDQEGRFRVLEDNARTPSGVSYVIENRQLMRRAFPDLMAGIQVRRVEDYGLRLQAAMGAVAPVGADQPQIVLLTPGVYNSAYFEHVFLAREMGVPLVEGRDLLVEDDRVYMQTTGGPRRVDVIYRRVDDDFLDPEAFRPDSALGVPGLLRAYRTGKVTLANGIGTGVADDKAVYAYMPRIIRHFLDQEPVLANVETHICREPEGLRYTLDHLEELVVKPVGASGGYGITVGPRASKRQLRDCRRQLAADPANYISQPMIGLSVSPTLIRGHIEPRHVDLRPFAVTGKGTWVLPGGLTRVALRKGSLDRQLVAGRRFEGYLGPCLACSPASPATASGSPATWSGPRIWPACCTSTRPSPKAIPAPRPGSRSSSCMTMTSASSPGMPRRPPTPWSASTSWSAPTRPRSSALRPWRARTAGRSAI